MKRKFLAEMSQEYQEFLASDDHLPSDELSARILTMVQKDLNPNAWLVFSKLSFIHFVSGIFTLSLCPQFGVHILGSTLGLMKLFSQLGTYGCMAACGAFFVGVTLLLSGLLLRPEEVRKLRRYWPLQISAIVLLSLGAFIMADAEILLGFGLAWMFGSMVGGFAMLELGWWVKRNVLLLH